eukprot:TRINITY_DN113_c2_g1_i1.p1 TRINITY_DN113_c2_g1~~TRINITY_DN113_c2_g1_i1.p1  ORF type:complete len:462 (+),score=124.22 TRINITY_DN113_c2_g1_i1:26-1387(+)
MRSIGVIAGIALLTTAAVTATDVCVDNILETDVVADFKLTCPTGQVITEILFASFGDPSGTCADDDLQSTVCGSDATLQQKIDSGVKLTLDSICYGKNLCYWFEYIVGGSGNVSAVNLFGDPCPHMIKTLSVKAQCGQLPSAPAPPSNSIWSTDQALNMKNFVATNQLVSAMYGILESNSPYDFAMSNFQALQLDVTPTDATPWRFVPLITYEKQFSITYSGFSTALFGIMTKIQGLENYLVIAFRGTVSATDWIYNLDVASVPMPASLAPSTGEDYSKAYIHQGFNALYSGMQAMVQNGVADYKPQGIILTGHSLGCALATLAAYDLANLGYPVHSVYLFASPRVGNPYFVDLFTETVNRVGGQVYRIANSADIVTQLPASSLGDGSTGKYLHVATLAQTYEYVPKNDTVLGLSVGGFVSWAHSLDTYRQYAPQFIDVSSTVAEDDVSKVQV